MVLKHEITEDNEVRFYFIHKESNISFNEWFKIAESKNKIGIQALENYLKNDNENFRLENNTDFYINQILAAKLDNFQAESLGLPQSVPFKLSISTKGSLASKDLEFNYFWQNNLGQPETGFKLEGAFIERNNIKYRLPEIIFSIVHEIEKFNENDLNMIMSFEKLSNKFPQEIGKSILVDGYLKKIKIIYPNSFSFDTELLVGGINITPLFFQVEKNLNDNNSINEKKGVSQEDHIFTPSQQQVFANHFKDLNDVHEIMALDDGNFLYLDNTMIKVAKLIKETDSKSDEIKKRFVENPQAYLEEEFGNELVEELKDIFIETNQYSERVAGVGLFPKISIPKATDGAKIIWFPNGDDDTWPVCFINSDGEDIYLKLNPEKIAEFNKVYEKAEKENNDSFVFNDEKIAINEKNKNKKNTLNGLIRPPTGPRPINPRRDLRILLTKENIEFIEYELSKKLEKRRQERSKINIKREEFLNITINSELQEHQKYAYNWLVDSWQEGKSGVLLADDMGLGKTLSVLAFLTTIDGLISTENISKKPILIVAPTGLIQNWINEFKKHLDNTYFEQQIAKNLYQFNSKNIKDLKKINEESDKKKEIESGKPSLDINILKCEKIILTTYEAVRNYQHSLAKIDFSVVIFDEIQKIKTPGSQMTRAAHTLNSEFSIGITGTPIEIRLLDLWSIFDTIEPNYLGTAREFARKYEGRETTKIDRENLKMKLDTKINDKRPYMLRRLKKDMNILPDKFEHYIEENMPEEQYERYKETINTVYEKKQGAHLKKIQDIKRYSLYPELPPISFGIEKFEHYVNKSAKFIILFKLLNEIKNKNEKCLIFLENRKVQKFTQLLIQIKFNISVDIINGDMVSANRQKIVDQFQEEEINEFNIIIISPKAGGVGLTLTNATNVIHLERWWNPAIEDQSTDRVYRIGQTRSVNIYYPIAKLPNNELGVLSFDENLRNRMNEKRNQSEKMLVPPPIDLDDLLNETDGSINDPGPKIINEIDRIDRMSPRDFEDWWMSRLIELDFINVNGTPKTGDGGADVIAEKNDDHYIFQCKHTTNVLTSLGSNAIDECVVAAERWQKPDAKCYAVTNAEKFTDTAIQKANDKDVKLITRNELLNESLK